jgi:hypothetical protein
MRLLIIDFCFKRVNSGEFLNSTLFFVSGIHSKDEIKIIMMHVRFSFYIKSCFACDWKNQWP